MQDIIQAWLNKQCGQLSVATGAVVLVLPRSSTALVPAAHWPAGAQPDAELTAAAASAYEREEPLSQPRLNGAERLVPVSAMISLSNRGEGPHRGRSGRRLRRQPDAAAPVGSRQRDARSGSIREVLAAEPGAGQAHRRRVVHCIHPRSIERCDAHSAQAVRRGQRVPTRRARSPDRSRRCLFRLRRPAAIASPAFADVAQRSGSTGARCAARRTQPESCNSWPRWRAHERFDAAAAAFATEVGAPVQL